MFWGPLTTSTKGIRCGGAHQWVISTFWGRFVFDQCEYVEIGRVTRKDGSRRTDLVERVEEFSFCFWILGNCFYDKVSLCTQHRGKWKGGFVFRVLGMEWDVIIFILLKVWRFERMRLRAFPKSSRLTSTRSTS